MKYKVTTIYNTVRFPLMPNEIRNALRDRFGGYDFDVEVDKDEVRIKELEEQVKGMRCCCSCKHKDKGQGSVWCTYIQMEQRQGCDSWQPRDKTTEGSKQEGK